MSLSGQIICIGDELLSGRVTEKNARYAAWRLSPLGIRVSSVVLIGDDPLAIKEALLRAIAQSDFVVVSGGLGVTDDDITARTAAEVLDLPLEESQRMVRHIRAFFEARGREMPQEAMRMATLPQGADLLCPDCAGFSLKVGQDIPVYFLPGIPAEARRIIDERVVPELVARLGGGVAVATSELTVFGIGESEVQARLSGLGHPQARIGYYPEFPEEKLLFTARAESHFQAQQIADGLAHEAGERLGDLVIASGGQTLEEVVGDLLLGRKLTLALAESCTGGLIGHRLTKVSGSSGFFERGYVVYSNQAKEEMLGVKHQTLVDHGAVSPQTAAEMAQGAARNSGTDVGLSVTGIAGPTGGSPEKPVGTVHFGLAHGDTIVSEHRRFIGDRLQVKALSAETALDILRRHLLGI